MYNQIRLLAKKKARNPKYHVNRRLLRVYNGIIVIRSLRVADCDTDHYLVVATVKEGIKQCLVADRYNINKLLDHETRKEYQIDVANRFSASE